ncbi:MAG: DUF2007 domain-containing protein [Chitinophagales bacterium]|nr:DUF2007 domain-containing protein [Chitinophagales bacterium]
MRDEDWIKVFVTSKLHQAVMVQSILRENSIDAVLLNQQDSSYITLGEISVLVTLTDYLEAENIIKHVIPI